MILHDLKAYLPDHLKEKIDDAEHVSFYAGVSVCVTVCLCVSQCMYVCGRMHGLVLVSLPE